MSSEFLLILYSFWSATYYFPSKQVWILNRWRYYQYDTYYTDSIKHFKAAPIQVPSCKFLRTAFSIERMRWLLLCLLEKKEEKSVEQKSKEKCLKWKKKMKTFHLTACHNMMLGWEMLSKNIFCLFWINNGYCKKVPPADFFNFSIQSQHFTGKSTGPDLL